MTSNVQEWMTEIGVDSQQIEIAKDMGLDFPIDFLLYPRDELTHFYGFHVETVDKIEATLAALQFGKGKGIEKCVALYPVASLKETYLEAKVGQEFAIINSSFDWWLCRNVEGEKGFLPSNHLKRVVDDEEEEEEEEALYAQPLDFNGTEGGDDPNSLYGHGASRVSAKDRSSSAGKKEKEKEKEREKEKDKESEKSLVLPTWMLRSRVKKMMSDALLSDNAYYITYNAVKKQLITEFGEATYRADIEHVKELIRRTEEKLRHRKNQTSAAEVMMHAATRHRFKSLKRRITASQRDNNPKSTDEVKDPELRKDIELVGAEGFSTLPTVPTNLAHFQVVGNTSGRGHPSRQFSTESISKVENDWFDTSASSWSGGWVLKKGENSNMFTSRISEKRRFVVPSDSGLKYFSDDTMKTLKGEIVLSHDTEIWFPATNGFKVMIEHEGERIYQLAACDQRCYDNLKRYLHSVLSRKVPFVSASDLQVVTPIKSSGNFSSAVVEWKVHGTVVKKSLKGIEFTDKVKVKQVMMGIRELCLHKHSNVVTSLGIGCEVTTPFVIQEYAERFSLRKLILQSKKDEILWQTRMSFLQDIARGMAYLHQEYRMPHLVLHSNNVLVTADMRLKISDYGIAWPGLGYTDMLLQLGGDDETSNNPRLSGIGIDEEGYVDSAWVRDIKAKANSENNFSSPPELWNPSIQFTTKSDVYSFAMILLEIITSKPADAEFSPDYNLQQLHSEGVRPTIPEDCPVTGLTRLMVNCWKENADDRPAFSSVLDRLVAMSPNAHVDEVLQPKGIV